VDGRVRASGEYVGERRSRGKELGLRIVGWMGGRDIWLDESSGSAAVKLDIERVGSSGVMNRVVSPMIGET